MNTDLIVLAISTLLLIVLLMLYFQRRAVIIHKEKMSHLKYVIELMLIKQQNLNQKITIISEHQNKYKSDVKKLSDEIILLQKELFKLLSIK